MNHRRQETLQSPPVTRRGILPLIVLGATGILFFAGCDSPDSPANETLPEASLPDPQGGETRKSSESSRAVGEVTAPPCATAVMEVIEGENVVAETTLQLAGDASFSPFGAITKWEWTVEQPEGVQSQFVPSANAANPTFTVPIPGEYTFSLTVVDEMNNASCAPASWTVVVAPERSIRVELVWDTPGDPDPTDEIGADLDLHFAHPSAEGADLDGDGQPDPWFDVPFDCFWDNPAPQWGSSAPAVQDDPLLHPDDDGAGPETLILKTPEDGATYRVGVHSFHDNGFGPSAATIRVLVGGELQYEASMELVKWDLWEVATIEWPSGEVTPIGNGEKILPEYIDPFFYQP